MTRYLRVDTARVVVLAYVALAILAASGYRQAPPGADHLWPASWAAIFAGVAVALVVEAVFVTAPWACVLGGGALHAAVIARLFATYANEQASVYVAGRAMVAVAFLSVVLLSSALVWRYLLWPQTHRS